MSCNILSNNKISNKDFLETMIKHHNVAIKMNNLLLMTSSNDYLLDYARRNKARQEDEIIIMKRSLNTLPNIQNYTSASNERDLLSNGLNVGYSDLYADVKCENSDFIEPSKLEVILSSVNEHGVCVNNAISKENISDSEYVDHMISHHNSAVALSKLLIKSTNEPRLFVLAQTIVADQQKDMFELAFLKNNLYNWKTVIPQKFTL